MVELLQYAFGSNLATHTELVALLKRPTGQTVHGDVDVWLASGHGMVALMGQHDDAAMEPSGQYRQKHENGVAVPFVGQMNPNGHVKHDKASADEY